MTRLTGREQSMLTNRLRMAINNGGPDFTYQDLQNQFRAQETRTLNRYSVYAVKNEFAFGMSDTERIKLLRTMQDNVRDNVSDFVRYNSVAFTNPNAIKALRQAALDWSAKGNDIAAVQDNDVRSFFRALVPDVPAEDREAALALVDQPAQYRRPLPGTRAANLAMSPYPTTAAATWASPNATQPAPQQQYGTGTTAFGNAIAPSTTNKRSFSTVNLGPASANDPPPAFKRARNDDVQQAFTPSAAYGLQVPIPPYRQGPHMPPATGLDGPNDQPNVFHGSFYDPSQFQPSSAWPASTGTSQSTAPYLPPFHMPPMTGPVISNYQADVFQGSFHDPSQAQPSSSWSASNSWGHPAAPYQPAPYMPPVNSLADPNDPAYHGGAFQGLNANEPSFAGQPFQNVPDISAPFDSWFMSDHELNETMKFIDNLAPLRPATQSQMAVSAPNMTAVSGQAASVPFPSGATLAQQPATTGLPTMAPVPTVPPARTPSTGQP